MKGLAGIVLLAFGLLGPILCAAQQKVKPSSTMTLSPESCLAIEMARPGSWKSRPVISLKKKGIMKTMLGLDAGNFRVSTYSSLLCQVEHNIKSELVKRKLVKYKSIHDFDVLIPDYFDMMPCTSAGCYIQAYMLTTGADAATAFPIITARPGSALGTYQFMLGVANFYNTTLGSLPASQRSNYSVTGPLLAQGYNQFLYQAYGNRSLHSYKAARTAALWAWTDLNGNTCLAPFIDPVTKRGGMNTLADSGDYSIDDQEDFYIWQMVSGATSWPPRVPPLLAETTPETPHRNKAKYQIADGIIASMDPVQLGLQYMMTERKVDLKNTAVFSIGSGGVYNQTVNQISLLGSVQNSNYAWFTVAANKYATVPFIKQVFRNVADPMQYLRIDYTFATPSDCNGLFTPDICPEVVYWVKLLDYSQVELYAQIGYMLGQQYKDQIALFVSKYLVAHKK